MLHGINIKFYLPFTPEVYSQTMKNEKSEVVQDFTKLHVNKAWCVFEWLALVRYAEKRPLVLPIRVDLH